MSALERQQVDQIVAEINQCPDAKSAFGVVSRLSKKLGFTYCCVVESVFSSDLTSDVATRIGVSSELVFSDYPREKHDLRVKIFRETDPQSMPGGRPLLADPFPPFAAGSNWFRTNGEPMSAHDKKYFDDLDEIWEPSGTIVYPMRSTQSEKFPVACVSMESAYTADWLRGFLETTADSVIPIIAAFDEKLYPHLVELENSRMNLTDRELECLRLTAEGHSLKGIAYELAISVAMASRHLRKIRTKMRVSNTAMAVLKAQRLGLVSL